MKTTIKFIAVIGAMLIASGLWAQEAEPPATQEAPVVKPQPADEGGVTVDTITSYLDKMSYVYRLDKSGKIPEIELRLRGMNDYYNVGILVDKQRQVAYLAVKQLMTIPDGHPRKCMLLQKLMELNWELLIGKYEWDKNDGEVRISYTFSTENGLGYDTFVACFELLMLTADRDYPKLMKLMWAELEETTEPPFTEPAEVKGEEGAKVKETEPKEDAPESEAPKAEATKGEAPKGSAPVNP